MAACPCGSEKNYVNCCGVFIEGKQTPTTPEALMRSRYTAYTQANIDYIARTMKAPASNHFNAVEARQWAERVKWLELKIVEAPSFDDQKGFVEFLAYFYDNNKRHAIHELSEFHKIDGEWYYVSGIAPKQKPLSLTRRISRNDPCHCGSGKKYKKCCGVQQ